jgi:hypothetical protein
MGAAHPARGERKEQMLTVTCALYAGEDRYRIVADVRRMITAAGGTVIISVGPFATDYLRVTILPPTLDPMPYVSDNIALSRATLANGAAIPATVLHLAKGRLFV